MLIDADCCWCWLVLIGADRCWCCWSHSLCLVQLEDRLAAAKLELNGAMQSATEAAVQKVELSQQQKWDELQLKLQQTEQQTCTAQQATQQRSYSEGILCVLVHLYHAPSCYYRLMECRVEQCCWVTGSLTLTPKSSKWTLK